MKETREMRKRERDMVEEERQRILVLGIL